ncbi:hypothetical protein [Metabacillus sp. RGM 3146]|uniref:hypothetical protein n=1 Tax=Metabacillus sp. RGM 3146 TaxID=3401092 RepID=UPI003B9CBCFB
MMKQFIRKTPKIAGANGSENLEQMKANCLTSIFVYQKEEPDFIGNEVILL